MLPEPYSALIDTSTSALLTLTFRIPIISFLAKTPIEGEHIYAVNYPNYIRGMGFVADADYNTFPEWTWNLKERLFTPTPKNLLTDRLRKASLLAVKKSQVLFEIMRTLTAARNPILTGLPLQETVYITKKMQAQAYRDGYCPEKYPYVLQYSEISGLTMQQAADEILLKASFDDDVLLKTEYFRLKYYERLRNVTEIALVDPIMISFRDEFYRTLMV